MTRDTTGLVGARATVIPDGWESHHAPVVDLTRTLPAGLWSGADPEWVWDGTSEVRDLGDLLWSGPVRLQQLNRTLTGPAGEQQVTSHEYLCVLPRTVEGASLAQWVHAKGQLFKVVDVLKGSLRFERDLIVTDNLG